MKNPVQIRGDGVAEIELSLGKVALIDAEDLPLVDHHNWYAAHINGKYWYAFSTTMPISAMSRLILGATKGQLVDHINRDTLDNRRCNLRFATRSQNSANAVKQRKPRSSRYKGVSWCKQHRKWLATIQVNGTPRRLGLFETEQAAAQAYNTAALEGFGEFAHLNSIQGHR